MAPSSDAPDGLTAFERRRAENAKANNELLHSITQTSTKIFGAAATKNTVRTKKAQPRRTRAEPVKRESPIPTRRSARVAGIGAENDATASNNKRTRGSELDGLLYDSNLVAAAERQKRMRISGDLDLSDMQVDGRWQGSLDGLGLGKMGAQPGVRTFKVEEDALEKTDGDVQKLRRELNGLQLYDKFEVKDLKLTKERIYAMAFHPTEEKAVVFAGDKEGRLGIFDASQTPNVSAKEEEADEDEEAEASEPVIVGFKPHARTISAIQVLDSEPGSVFTASYDTTVRRLDLQAHKSVEVYAPHDADANEDAAISCIDFAANDPSLLFFSTLQGVLGRHDLRTASSSADLWPALHDGHKIGGFSVSPRQPHLIATASLDRTMKIWDLRKMVAVEDSDSRRPSLLGEDPARLSVSHAAWGPGGHVATTSYDDTVRVYDFSGAGAWKPAKPLSEDVLSCVKIPHNNQTGRWVTILKPQWQRRPLDGVHKFALGNMNRFVDIYAANGEQLAQLDGDGITAVPAVALLHPTQNWVAGGNASGKLTLWM